MSYPDDKEISKKAYLPYNRRGDSYIFISLMINISIVISRMISLTQHVEGMVQTKNFWQSYKLCIFWSIFPYGITWTIQKNPHLVLTFSDFFKLLFESNRWFAYNEILIWAVLSGSTVEFCLKITFGMLFFNVWAI